LHSSHPPGADELTAYTPRLKIEMKNAPSFLGYSRLSAEVTAGATDHREQIDLSTDHPLPGKDAPLYYNLLAPNQWPASDVLPEFRRVFTAYMKQMGEISLYFTSLIAEAIELPANSFDKYFDGREQQHKLKIVKYPDVGVLGEQGRGGNQGVGPHKDSSRFFPFSHLSGELSLVMMRESLLRRISVTFSAQQLPVAGITSQGVTSAEYERRVDRLPANRGDLGCGYRTRPRGSDAGRLREHHAPCPLAGCG